MATSAVRQFLVSTLTIVLLAQSAAAADRRKIRAVNIGAQAVVTLISGLVQGKVRSGADIARCLLAGSASGYAFYEAKELVADDHVRTGWMLTNVAMSLSENAAAGRHPLSQFGYSVGPLRFRVPIPALDREADSYVLVDFFEYEAIAMIYAYRDNDHMSFRDGLIVFERDSLYPADDDGIEAIGRTYGMFPGLSPLADEATWPHEVIHAVQALQGDAAEPALPFLSYKPRREREQPKHWIRFEHLKLGVMNAVNDRIAGEQPYHERWFEIEAFRLTEDVAPPRF